MGLFAGHEGSAVVAAALDGAGAFGGHAVVFARDADLGGFEALLEVGADRGDEKDNGVFSGGADSNTRRSSDHERTDVERGASAVGRDETLVEFNDLADHFAEELFGHRLHLDALCGADKALGVFIHAEYADFAVDTAESLKALEGLLAVVEA